MRRDLIFSDPPLHTAIRAVFGRALAGRINDELRGRMERIANDLLDAVAAQGGMDLIQDFADRFPFLIIADLMGIPLEDCERLRVVRDPRTTRNAAVGPASSRGAGTEANAGVLQSLSLGAARQPLFPVFRHSLASKSTNL